MVCVICFEPLFGAPQKHDGDTSDSTADEGRLAALNCGHTFHHKCALSWLAQRTNSNCPMCNVAHPGAVLKLYIECDREHAENNDLGDLGLGNLQIGNVQPQDSHSTEQQAEKVQTLEKEVAEQQQTIEDKSGRLRKRKEKIETLYKRLHNQRQLMEYFTEKAERHITHIQGLQTAIARRNETIEVLKETIRNMETQLA